MEPPPMVRQNERRRRFGKPAAAGVSLLVHALAAVVIVASWRRPATGPQPPTLALDLNPAILPTPARAPRPAPEPQPHPARRPQRTEQRRPPEPAAPAAPARVRTPMVIDDALPAGSGADAPGLSDAELAGAAIVGGGGGGVCDMAARVQTALRRDPMVRTAVLSAEQDAARPMLVWNGDWVRSPEEDGKGLAAVREAVEWAVGFSPAPCRAQAVRGFVLISLGGGPGAPRLALGAARWRWSDLLQLDGLGPRRPEP